MAKSDVAVKVASTTALALVSSLEQDAGAGLEHMDKEDFALPFLRLLASNSPEVSDVEGARPGMFYNSVTGQLHDGKEGITVVPVAYQRVYVEWAPRGSGSGGPASIHSATSDILSRTHRVPGDNKDYLDNGNYVENTANHYIMIVDKDGTPAPALITMKSTQLKKSRKWNSMMMAVKLQGKNGLFTPPIYSQLYRLTSMKESNDKGSWFGWEIERIGTIPDEWGHVYSAAKQFAESVNKGEVQAKHEADKVTAEHSHF